LDQSPWRRRRRLDQPALSSLLTAEEAQGYSQGPFVVLVRTRPEFERWLDAEIAGLEGLQVEDLLGDPEVWARAAQGSGRLPLDVVVAEPARDFSALYRLADVRLVRPVGVTLMARPGFLKALRLAASLQLPVRLLPGQPDAEGLAELEQALQFAMHDTRVEAPVEFFHSLLASFRGFDQGTLWDILQVDPGPPQEECASCRYQSLCAGFFKNPDPTYNCDGVRQIFSNIESMAEEISRDLAAS